MRKRREPKLLKCTVINPPETPEEQEAYDNLVFETLATALCRSFQPEEVDRIIEVLETMDKEN